MNDAETIARAIITQMSREDREDFTPDGWRDGVSAMLQDGWEGADLEEVLSAIDAALTESADLPEVSHTSDWYTNGDDRDAPS